MHAPWGAPNAQPQGRLLCVTAYGVRAAVLAVNGPLSGDENCKSCCNAMFVACVPCVGRCASMGTGEWRPHRGRAAFGSSAHQPVSMSCCGRIGLSLPLPPCMFVSSVQHKLPILDSQVQPPPPFLPDCRALAAARLPQLRFAASGSPDAQLCFTANTCVWRSEQRAGAWGAEGR